jgi:hypothetical protein
MNSGLNLSQFLAIQPWILPVNKDTYQQLISSSYQFYTILSDSHCRILYQEQYCEIAIPSSPSLPQIPPLSPPLSSPLSLHSKVSSESKFVIPKEGKQFDIPIELIIAISPPTTSSRPSSNQPPSLFLKINNKLYLTNHTAIQELTFPRQQTSSPSATSASTVADQLYLLLKWPTCSFYLYILPDQYSSPLLHQQGTQYAAPIIHEKLSAAVISMNRILRCSLASFDKLKQQLQQKFQQIHSKRLRKFQENHPHPVGESSSWNECSSTTIGGDLSSPSDSSKESTSLLSSIESLLTSPSHLFALDCIQSSLHHWIDTTAISRHLLQPVLPSPLYQELLLSSYLPPNPLSQNLSSSQASSSFARHKKRSLPSAAVSPPMTPSQTQTQTHQSSLNSPLTKRPKLYPIDRSGIPPLCLLNLPKDLTLSDSDSVHPFLDSCLLSLSSSLLSIEESESLEKTLYETLDFVEAKILNSYSTHFALSRPTPSPKPMPGTVTGTGQIDHAKRKREYCEELEKIFATPYRALIEDITTLRLLPRNDRRPLHPHLSAPTSQAAASASINYTRNKS